MGQRSDFERIGKDKYRTPKAAVLPLLRHLPANTHFAEPCAGGGRLIDHLSYAGHTCVDRLDIEPDRADIRAGDALTWTAPAAASHVITNPPWSRPLLHDLIVHFSDQRPTWLLFDADWIQTRRAIPFLPRLAKVVSIGRVKWIDDSPFTGNDNAAWHLFENTAVESAAFYRRAA